MTEAKSSAGSSGKGAGCSRTPAINGSRIALDRLYERYAFEAGLTLVDPDCFTIIRERRGKGFVYRHADGTPVRDPEILERIRGMVIPPAWSNVTICTDAAGHIQACGQDEKGRRQYCYHAHWEEVRNRVKARRLLNFGKTLPRIRAQVARDLRRKTIDRPFASATAVRLIDKAGIRAGHEKYAADGGRGAMTLKKSHVKVGQREIRLTFNGKSGQAHDFRVRDPVIARRLRQLKRLPGRRLFSYRSGRAGRSDVSSLTADRLNRYIADIARAPVSAKDFRTFVGSALALRELIESGERTGRTSKRQVTKVMRTVSEFLRNTPAVARSSYVHPSIIDAFESGELSASLLGGNLRKGLDENETALMRFLEQKFPEGS